MIKLVLRNIQRTRTNYINLSSINHNKLYLHIGVFKMAKEVKIDKEELRKRLTPLQYHVTQEKGTERPFSGCYNKIYDEGLYTCIVCEQPLFSSNTKYDSSCGWPAFNDVLDEGKVKLSPDTSGVVPKSNTKTSIKNTRGNDSEDEFVDLPQMKEINTSISQNKDNKLYTNLNIMKKRKNTENDFSPPHKKIYEEIAKLNLNKCNKSNSFIEINNTGELQIGDCSNDLKISSKLRDSLVNTNIIESMLTSNQENINNDQAKTETSENHLEFDTFLDMDFDNWEDDVTEKVEELTLDLTPPCHCKILRIKHLQSKLILSLISTQNNKKGLCNVEGFWIYTNLEINNTVYINAKNIYGTWIINNDYGFIVFEPDLLVSSTSVVGSLWCKRRSVLSERFKGFESTNQAMLVGSLVHSTLQYALRNNISDTVNLEKFVKKLTKNSRVVKQLYECGTSLKNLETEIVNYIPKIQEFINFYIGNACTSEIQNKHSWKGKIETIDDIEENIWCPELGIKGKIDVTIKTKEQIMPLELKTGRATVSLEHRGQVMLYLMMMKKVGYNVTSGLLLYLKEGFLKEIPSSQKEERDLIRLRNELVFYLTKNPVINDDNLSIVPPKLPDPINHPSCSKCPYQNICTSYAYFTNEDISSNNTLKKLQEETLRYLKESHIKYFMKWTCLLIIEGQTNSNLKEVKEIYLLSPEQREAKGRCVANLKISKVSEEADETFQHTFEKNDKSFNIAKSGIIESNYIVVSSEKRFAVAAGFVNNVSSGSISISLDRNLSKKYQNQKFCIDSYDSSMIQTFQFSSLALLLEPTPKGENLRKIIIDKEPPTFKSTLPKIIGTVGKSILKRLNIVQQRAVLKAITANDYFLIKGMPGTGKTATVVALIQLLYTLNKTILITSHTNSAVDNVCLKLLQYEIKFMRIGTESKIHQDLREYSEYNLTKNCSTPEEYEYVYNSVKILAVTCIGSGHPLLTKRTFDICIVDESTQVLQSSVIRPLYACKSFILIGDPDQLPSVVKNNKARELGMTESLFERLYRPEATLSLNINYRMNKTITFLANTLTYNGELKVGNETIENATISVDTKCLESIYMTESWILRILDNSLENAVQFLDTGPIWNLPQDVPWKIMKGYAITSSDDQSNKYSAINIYEAAIIFKIVKALIKSGISPQDIGVIGSYRHQVEQLTAILESDCIDINTVDQFQGKDKSIIIYSCGNSRDTSVFNLPGKYDILEDKRRLTVAITRAKHKLVLVGDVATLSVYSTFKKMFSSFNKNIIKVNDCKDFVWTDVLNLNCI